MNVWERVELHPGSVSVTLHSRVSGRARAAVESTLTTQSARSAMEWKIKVRANNSTAILLYITLTEQISCS